MSSKNRTKEERFIEELKHYAHIWQHETDCMVDDPFYETEHDARKAHQNYVFCESPW